MTTKPIPTASEARTHPLLGTIRNAARGVQRDGQTRYVWATYTTYAIELSPRPSGRYFVVTANNVTRIED